MKQLGQVCALLMLLFASSCSKREAECKTLVGAMRNLGKKLTLTQTVTSSENASAQQVASALRTFANEASRAGETLASSQFTIPELRQIATDASSAAQALAGSARRMVDAAERMKGLEPAQRATRIQRTLADVALTNIERYCATNPTECNALSKVLRSRPPLPDIAVAPEQAVAWNGQMTAWLDELTALVPPIPELQHQRTNLAQTSKAYATALSTLAASHDSASELTQATQALSAQITVVDAAMTATQSFCKR